MKEAVLTSNFALCHLGISTTMLYIDVLSGLGRNGRSWKGEIGMPCSFSRMVIQYHHFIHVVMIYQSK